MIRYSLACDAGHRFETWFRDSDAFEHQVSRKLVACPDCHSSSVAKTIMSPAILSARRASSDRQPDVVAPAPPTVEPLLDEGRIAARALVRAMRETILAEGHDVGTCFPAEARRMHDGEIPTRPIHGKASRDEAIGLLEDGILVLPLPAMPEELN